MITRSKLVAAVLGFAVATVTIGDASAATIVKSGAMRAANTMHATHNTHFAGKATTAKVIGHKPHRVIVGTRIVRHLRVVHRAPAVVKVVRIVAPTKVVHIVKRPLLQRQALAHRVIVKKTVIR